MSDLHRTESMIPKKLQEDLKKVIKDISTPTGNFEADKAHAENYAKAVGMDAANTEAAIVMSTQGMDAAAKFMIAKSTTEDGKFDYNAMRERFG